jgi:hypothetical protein
LCTFSGMRYRVSLPNSVAPTRPASPELIVPTSVVCVLTMSWPE